MIIMWTYYKLFGFINLYIHVCLELFHKRKSFVKTIYDDQIKFLLFAYGRNNGELVDFFGGNYEGFEDSLRICLGSRSNDIFIKQEGCMFASIVIIGLIKKLDHDGFDYNVDIQPYMELFHLRCEDGRTIIAREVSKLVKKDIIIDDYWYFFKNFDMVIDIPTINDFLIMLKAYFLMLKIDYKKIC